VLGSQRLPVPVVVIGNITVGGVGKTPLVIYLAQALRSRGYVPGIISRGYGGAGETLEVFVDSDPRTTGDEPLLIRRRSGCPVVVGRDRFAAGKLLLSLHPELDLVLSDDGLQHYRLARDIEMAVMDSTSLMNRWLLPAGPLREPLSRLNEMDALVGNGTDASSISGVPFFRMTTRAGIFYRADDPDCRLAGADFSGQRLHAVAGIGRPQRFFDTLLAMGMEFTPHAFPDHHIYRAEDLCLDGDVILTTEKDAVKLEALRLALPVWVLPLEITVEPDLAVFIVEKLNGSAFA
jgi:tetraacyldisaccharide 4'-kinase